jgi:hypothetical protein
MSTERKLPPRPPTPAQWRSQLRLGTSLRLLRKLLSDNIDAGALAQGSLQVRRAPVLLQQVSERLIGQFLEVLHPVARQQIERFCAAGYGFV